MATPHQCKLQHRAHLYTLCPLCKCEYCPQTWPVCPRSAWHPAYGTDPEDVGRRYVALAEARQGRRRKEKEGGSQ